MYTNVTKYGTRYSAPIGVNELDYYELMYEFTNLAKEKGLTVRQAQILFRDCSDMILDAQMKNDTVDEKSLKSIADSLNKIATNGIDIYKRSSSTNY